MSNPSKNATFKAIIDAVVTELMFKTTGDQVYLNETTTVSAKIAEMIAAINLRAKTEDVNGLIEELTAEIEKKAGSDDVTAEIDALRKTHTDDTATFNAKFDELLVEMSNMIDALRQEILGDVPVEAYDTFTELAAYIEEHQEVSDALTAAIGTKADKSVVDEHTTKIGELENNVAGNRSDIDELTETVKSHATLISSKVDESTLGSLATKDTISETDLDAELKEKVNAASDGNHSHENKTTLDGITSDRATSWDGKATLHISVEQPEDISNSDIWFRITN